MTVTAKATDLKPEVAVFFDSDSNTFSYIVKDPSSKACAIIDPVLDFDYAAGRTSYKGADAIIKHIKTHQLHVEWLIETHVHADHLSSAPYIKKSVGGKIAISEHIPVVQNTFAGIFNTDNSFKCDGSQFDYLFKDNEQYQVGNMPAMAMHTPGHTPACMTHIIGDACFVGDTLFMPDAGTARTDFPGGDAATLFNSVQRIMNELPDQTRVFMCHDYAPEGREIEYLTTIADQKRDNIHVNQSIDSVHFIAMREARDKTLDAPRLILPSLQVNMRAGEFPEAEDNGTIYLKLPINIL
jgi:glyoxylase-like metal-dependent hydrolase (beta-lactamase superfamily II)